MGNPTINKIALVTGATGAVGPDLVRELVEYGYSVRTLTRHNPSKGLFPDGVETIRGDVRDATTVRHAVDGCDSVFHLAAKLHINNPSPKLQKEYEAVNVEGTRLVVDAAQSAGVRRIIYFSTINVYKRLPQTGNTKTTLHTEDSPVEPDSLYGITKLQGEKIALAATRHDGKALATVLRLAAVYGPHMKGNYIRMAHALNRRVFIPIGKGNNRRTLVHSADVARAALQVAESPVARGRIYNVTDGTPHTFNEVMTAICRALQRPVPKWSAPVTPIRISMEMAARSAQFFGQTLPVNAGTVDKLVEDIAVSSERIQREVGFNARIKLSEGWQQLLRTPDSGHLANSLFAVQK